MHGHRAALSHRPWLPPADIARALEVSVICSGWSGDTLPNFSRTSASTLDISTLSGIEQ